MTLMEQEIFQQPDALKTAALLNAPAIRELKTAAGKAKIRSVVMAARGSSNHACIYFKYLCEVYAGLPVSFAAPSALTLYGGKLSYKNTLVIGVSQSGAAKDALTVMRRAKETGGLVAAVTNNKDSEMAGCADFHLFLGCGAEQSVAATKTFTAQMYVLALLAAALSKDNGLRTALKTVPAIVKKTLKLKGQLKKAALRYLDAPDGYILARGTNYAAAREAALKLMETTYFRARAFAASNFHHGPFAVMSPATRALLFCPAGESFASMKEMLAKLKDTGCDITVFSDDEALCAEADSFVLTPSAPDSVSPFIYVAAAQLFALSLAEAKGLNPDAPRGLKKITVTV